MAILPFPGYHAHTGQTDAGIQARNPFKPPRGPGPGAHFQHGAKHEVKHEVAEILTSLSRESAHGRVLSWSPPLLQPVVTDFKAPSPHEGTLPSFQELEKSIDALHQASSTERRGSYGSDAPLTPCSLYSGSSVATTPEELYLPNWRCWGPRRHAALSPVCTASPALSRASSGFFSGDKFSPPTTPPLTPIDPSMGAVGGELKFAHPVTSGNLPVHKLSTTEPAVGEKPFSTGKKYTIYIRTESSHQSGSSALTSPPPRKLAKDRRAGKSGAGKRNNQPYPEAFMDFVTYKRVDRNMQWKAISSELEANRHRLTALVRADEEGQRDLPARTVGGITSVYYRFNAEIPRTDEHGALIFTPDGREATRWLKVRDAKDFRIPMPGAIERNPERIAAANYWFIEPEDMARAVKLAAQRDRQRVAAGLPTWAEQQKLKKLKR